MHDARLDPGGFYEFNLSGGTVRTCTGDRVVLLSDTVLAALVAAAANEGDLTPLRRLGELLGDQAVRVLVRPATLLSGEAVLGVASGMMALFGWGRLEFERWGDAMVLVAGDLPAVDSEQLGAAALLGGLFSNLSQRQVACVPVGTARFIMVDLEVAETVWGWYKDGADLPQIVGRLASKTK